MPMSSKTMQSTKENYCIFILSVETDTVPSILKEFIRQIKSQLRPFVVSIVLDDIAREISLEKEIRKTKSSEAEDDMQNSSSKISESYQPSLEEMLAGTKKQINKCIVDNDKCRAELEACENLDILEYWKTSAQNDEQKDINENINKKGQPDNKAKKGPPISKKFEIKNSLRKSDNKSHESNEQIQSFNDDMKERQLIVHPFTQIAGCFKEKKMKYIKDNPENGPIFYIVLIGFVSLEFLSSLIRETYPIDAIISFCPKQHSFTSISEQLSVRDETKNINLLDLEVPRINKCHAAVKSRQIFDELCWLLYDTEIKKRQHATFLSHVKEIDVSMNEKCHNVAQGTDIPVNASDDIIIPLYLDDLLNKVAGNNESSSNSQETRSEASEPSLLDEEYQQTPLITIGGLTIIEYKNNILREFLTHRSFNENLYSKCIEQIKTRILISNLWCKFHQLKSTLRFTYSNSSFKSTFKLKSSTSFCRNNEISYYEIISKDTLIQRLQHACEYYSHYTMDYSGDKDEIYIRFYEQTEPFTEKTIKNVIPTKVCFRDYCKYLEEETKVRLSRIGSDNEKQFANKKNAIDDSDFIMKSSLKMKAATSQEKPSDENRKFGPLNYNNQENSKVSMANSTRTDEAQNKFHYIVYNLSDTWFEITSTHSRLRIVNGFVDIHKDLFPADEYFVRINITFNENHIFVNRSYPKSNECSVMRILCNNGSTIYFNKFKTMNSKKSDSISMESIGQSEYSQAGENDSINAYFPIYITWPSGLQIRSVHDEETGEVLYIEQISQGMSNSEVKRLYYPNGMLAIYDNDGNVQVYSSSGTAYEVKKYDGQTTSTPQVQNGYKMEAEKYKNEFNIFQNLTGDFDKSQFNFITPDGKAIEVFSGNFIHKIERKHYIEWQDYVLEEWYSMIEHGIKTRLIDNRYEVYYPNGTMFTTFCTDDNVLLNPVTEASELFVNIESVEKHGADSSTIENTEELEEEESLEYKNAFVAVNCSYLIQHENYATIHFEEDHIRIACPLEMDFILRDNKIEINIKNEFTINCNPDECTIEGCNDSDRNNILQAILDLKDKSETLMHIKSGLGAELTINKDGKTNFTSASHTRNVVPREKQILITKNMQGFEGFCRKEVKEKFDDYQKSGCIQKTSEEILTVLEPLRRSDEIFKMRTPHLDLFMEKFVSKSPLCRGVPKPPLDNLAKEMTVRSFISVTEYFRQMNPSINEITSKRLQSLDEIRFGNGALEYFEHECNSIIEKHLIKSTQLAKVNLLSTESLKNLPSARVLSHPTEAQLKRNRKIIYFHMLRNDYFPKYADFKNADNHVQNMNLTEYEQQYMNP